MWRDCLLWIRNVVESLGSIHVVLFQISSSLVDNIPLFILGRFGSACSLCWCIKGERYKDLCVPHSTIIESLQIRLLPLFTEYLSNENILFNKLPFLLYFWFILVYSYSIINSSSLLISPPFSPFSPSIQSSFPNTPSSHQMECRSLKMSDLIEQLLQSLFQTYSRSINM